MFSCSSRLVNTFSYRRHRAVLLSDIKKIGTHADQDQDIKERCKKLQRAVASWNTNGDELLGAHIAQAMKVAADAMVQSGLSRSEKLTRDEVEGEEQDEAQDDVPTRKRKRGEDGSTSVPSTVRRQIPTPLYLRMQAVSIILPSRCVRQARAQDCLKSAVLVETSLRQGQARDALDDLRTQLITSQVVNETIQKRSKRAMEGKARSTRYVTTIIVKHSNVLSAAAEYRRAYAALLALGAPPSDEFKPLAHSDVKAFVTSTQHQKLGQSSQQPSWIWQNLRFLEVEEVNENFSSYTEAGQ